MRVENPLAQFSVEPLKESQRLARLTPEEQVRELLQNLRGYENEVLKDEPVSIAYSYWFDEDGQAYTHPSKKDAYKFKDQFDPQERGIFPLEGFDKMTRLIRQNPGKVVLWYSPKGPAAFDNKLDNPYRDIDFIYGQLYLQYFDPVENKASAVAIKVTDEAIFSQLMPDVYDAASLHSGNETIKERIATFLLNPINTSLSIDQFLAKNWNIANIYTDKSGENRSFNEVLDKIRKKLVDNLDHVSKDAWLFAQKLAGTPMREGDILRTYLEFVKVHQITTGEKVTNLMGACGGRSVSAEELNDLLGIGNSFSNVYSTEFRLSTQTPDYKKDPNLCRCSKAGEAHFHCPGKKEGSECGHPIVVGKGIAECPACGMKKVC